MPRHRTKNRAVEEHASATAERTEPFRGQRAHHPPPSFAVLHASVRGQEGHRFFSASPRHGTEWLRQWKRKGREGGPRRAPRWSVWAVAGGAPAADASGAQPPRAGNNQRKGMRRRGVPRSPAERHRGRSAVAGGCTGGSAVVGSASSRHERDRKMGTGKSE
jgi:hypothetical protein